MIVRAAALKRLRRLLAQMDRAEAALQEIYGDAVPRSTRAANNADAESLRHVLDQIDTHFAGGQPAPVVGPMPPGKPAFTVEVVSNYNGGGRLLRWADHGSVGRLNGTPTGNYEGREVHYGTFACYPVHDGGALIEPTSPDPEPVKVPWPFPVSAHTGP